MFTPIEFVNYFCDNRELFVYHEYYNFNGVHVYLRSIRISFLYTLYDKILEIAYTDCNCGCCLSDNLQKVKFD